MTGAVAERSEALAEGSGSPTEVLARFASDLTYDDIPADVVEHAQVCVLDALGCGLFASSLPWCRIVNELVVGESAPGLATVWGTDLRVSATGAAMANGTSGHGFELDDIHPGGLHPGPLAVSAALSLGEERGASGRDVLTALVAGYEVGCRIAMALLKGHAKAGFHAQGTIGSYVATAAAGRMIGLSPAQMRHAFAIVGSMGAGLLAAQKGGMTKRIHSGRAAQSGVTAALLAEKGFTGIPDVLENSFGGFVKAMGGTTDDAVALAGLTETLGEVWETRRVGFKIYPSCGGTHSALHAARELRRAHALDPADIDSVFVQGSSHAVMKVGAPYVPNGIAGAQMNLAFTMALVLRFGAVPIDRLSDDGVTETETLALAGRISMEADPAIDALGPAGRHASRVRITLVDGQTLEQEVPFRPGSEKMPVTADDVREKFRGLATTTLSREQVEELERRVLRLAEVDDVAQLTALLVPAPDGFVDGSG
jgi:2-methylcitrate dehydratase PrpD